MVTGNVNALSTFAEQAMSESVFLAALSLMCGTVVVLGSLRFFRRYIELKHEQRVPLAINGWGERLERIESAVESTAIEVERISEANRFMAKLLAERAGATNLPSRPERVITPH
jgi:hypothetical protein